MMPTPYAEHVGDRDPVDVLRASLDEYDRLIAKLTPALWAQPWAPGKWTAAQIMLHVAQWEMIMGVRVRSGLTVPNFVVTPLTPDDVNALEAPVVSGPTAYAAFAAVRRMNLALAASLSTAQRHIRIRHQQRGDIDIQDLIVTLAGHGVHHLRQLMVIVD